jgi:hypothetical protein
VDLTTQVTGVLPLLNGGTGADNATDARTNLGATTIGSNLFTLPDPSAVTFPRFNVDNTVSPLNATGFRTAIGAGTVTSVGGTGTVNGITLTGTVTTSGNLTLGGTLSGVDLTTQVTGVLPIANGGTNATTAADARTNLGLAEYLNPVVNIALTGSPFTYQNVNEYSLDILIGGNVGGVVNLEFSRDNLTWYTTGSFYGQITLSPNDRIRITYVGPPTVTGIPR